MGLATNQAGLDAKLEDVAVGADLIRWGAIASKIKAGESAFLIVAVFALADKADVWMTSVALAIRVGPGPTIILPELVDAHTFKFSTDVPFHTFCIEGLFILL